jgi:hypothetical protein
MASVRLSVPHGTPLVNTIPFRAESETPPPEGSRPARPARVARKSRLKRRGKNAIIIRKQAGAQRLAVWRFPAEQRKKFMKKAGKPRFSMNG